MNHEAKLIVFDWDGTLMDSAAHIVNCLQNAITELSLEPKTSDELKNIIGLGLREALFALYPQATDEELTALVDRYRKHFFDPQTAPCELFTGARELVEELYAKDYFLAVATGKGRNGLDKVLKETGMGEFFPITRCADETHSKPHPQMMLDIIDYYGIEANEAIMVGDTEYDLQMASNAAAHSVAVTYGVHEKQRLLDCKPLTCLDSINDLHQWLLN
ncbi:MAG: HAD-IA family hydrolase [Gammaproteobacteria bacterium]|nr:HAD-IA family hydrolase [Gammaproteobacteria bacterium]